MVTRSGVLLRLQMLSWLFDSLITTKEDSDQVQQSRPVGGALLNEHLEYFVIKL